MIRRDRAYHRAMVVSRAPWPLLSGGPVPDDMVFVADPPRAIGEVIGGWTNNGPAGPKPAPLSSKLLAIGGGALTGFAVGLVAFFVIAGTLEQRGTRIEADWFLVSLAVGTLLGAALGMIPALRRPGVITLFVGTEGCAQIEMRDGRVETQLVEYAAVESLREHVSVMVAQGIRTETREIHKRDRDSREKLWWVSMVPGERNRTDPQVAFGDAVLRAFADHLGRR